MSRLAILGVLIAGACTGSSSSTGGGKSSGGSDAGAHVRGDASGGTVSGGADAGSGKVGSTACDLAAIGLGSARKIARWAAPAACKRSLGDAVTIRTEQEFAVQFTCTGGATSGIDFAKDQLIIQVRTLSPAGAGGEAVDDGKVVTYVSYQRKNCPNDPMPRPMDYEVMFLLPAGSARSFADASCTVGGEPDCR